MKTSQRSGSRGGFFYGGWSFMEGRFRYVVGVIGFIWFGEKELRVLEEEKIVGKFCIPDSYVLS